MTWRKWIQGSTYPNVTGATCPARYYKMY